MCLITDLVKNIGVSNYTVSHLKDMTEYAKVTPAVNQVLCPLVTFNLHCVLPYCQDIADTCLPNSLLMKLLDDLSPASVGMLGSGNLLLFTQISFSIGFS